MQSGTFVYRNYQGIVRTVRMHHVTDGVAAAAVLSALLFDTEVTWRATR